MDGGFKFRTGTWLPLSSSRDNGIVWQAKHYGAPAGIDHRLVQSGGPAQGEADWLNRPFTNAAMCYIEGGSDARGSITGAGTAASEAVSQPMTCSGSTRRNKAPRKLVAGPWHLPFRLSQMSRQLVCAYPSTSRVRLLVLNCAEVECVGHAKGQTDDNSSARVRLSQAGWGRTFRRH